MKVLITGGCGFVGSNLAVAFAAGGHAVTVFDNLSRRGSDLLRVRVADAGADVVIGDVRDPAALERVKGEFDVMIECSAEPSVLAGADGRQAKYLLDVNLAGAINCFEWARARKVPVIFLSSSRVFPYDKLNACEFIESKTRFELARGCQGVTADGVAAGMPLDGVRSLYGASKLCGELILREYAAQYDLPAIIDRCGVIAGPWQLGRIDQGVFTFWLAQHYFKRPLAYIGHGGEGKQVRDLLHIDDLIRLVMRQAVCLASDAPRYRGDVFNAGGGAGSSLSLSEATEICRGLTGHSFDIPGVPQARPADMTWFITDNAATHKEFGWAPRLSARDILKDTHTWIRAHEADLKKIFDGDQGDK
jgi:CDP-paratose 2-epimerase